MIPNDIQEKLYEDYAYYIHYIINKYFYKSQATNTMFDHDDLFQEGWMILLRAYENYDESKGIEFPTYFGQCLKLKLRSYIAQNSTPFKLPRGVTTDTSNIKLVYLDDPISSNTDSLIYNNLISDGSYENRIEYEEFLKFCKDIIGNDQYFDIWYNYHVLRISQITLSKKYKCGRSTISMRIRTCDRKIKKGLDERKW